mmetsp:Transcript_113346/g.360364  ORF Transcript_113346/g.360364 Transcript_113346/m.360364 type:complete len:369 (+) Transcript_113346:982-2088(+)
MVCQDRHDRLHRAEGHLRERQASHVHQDDTAFDMPRENHVADHVLDAEDEDPDHPVRAGLLVVEPRRGYSCGPDHQRWPQQDVPACEVDNAVGKILLHRLVNDGAGLKELFPPLLRGSHILHGSFRVALRAGQVPRCRCGQCRRESLALSLRQFSHDGELLLLLLGELDVAMDLPLRLAVFELGDNRLSARGVGEHLLWQRERRHVGGLDDKSFPIWDRVEAVHLRRALQRRHRLQVQRGRGIVAVAKERPRRGHGGQGAFGEGSRRQRQALPRGEAPRRRRRRGGGSRHGGPLEGGAALDRRALGKRPLPRRLLVRVSMFYRLLGAERPLPCLARDTRSHLATTIPACGLGFWGKVKFTLRVHDARA